MKITSKGQVTIPQDIREKYGFMPETEVLFQMRDNGELVVTKDKTKKGRGWEIVKHLTGRLKGGLTTDELMALTRGED